MSEIIPIKAFIGRGNNSGLIKRLIT